MVVRLTDVAPVDSPVYFEDGTAMAFGLDGAEDGPIAEVLSGRTRSAPSCTPASSW